MSAAISTLESFLLTIAHHGAALESVLHIPEALRYFDLTHCEPEICMAIAMIVAPILHALVTTPLVPYCLPAGWRRQDRLVS